MNVLVQAAVAKYCRLCGLNSRHLFLTVPEAGKSRMKTPAELLSGNGPPPGS